MMRRTAVAILVLVHCAMLAQAQNVMRILPARPPERLDAVVAGMLKVRLHADVMRTMSPTDIAVRNGLHIEHAYLNDAQRVRVVNDASMPRPTVRTSARLREIEERLLRSYVMRYDERLGEPEQVCRRLQHACSDIEIAEPVFISELCAEPNDPRVGEQDMLRTIKAFEAWEIEDGDSTVLIGISDSGIKQDHEDLTSSLYVNEDEIPDNGIDDDGNGYIDDHRGYNFCTKIDGTAYGNTFNAREGHGTGVAGICGATVNNGIGIAGVANACRLVPLKTMPDNVPGIVYGYESIMYCAINGIQVVNCSWGGFSRSCIDDDVIAYAIERGTAVVAAAGNHGTAAPFYPSAYPGVLGVGVTDASDQVIGMSSRGSHVDVMAPGQGTLTTGNDGTYGGFCCTSGASPIAAAVVALVRARHPELTPQQACAIVQMSVDDIDILNVPSADLIPGRINALRAVTLPPDSMPAVRVEVTSIEREQGGRWGPGDHVDVSVRFASDLAGLRDASAELDVVGPASGAIRLKQINTYIGTIVAGGLPTPTMSLTSYDVVGDVDTTTFIRISLRGKTSAGDDHRRSLLIPVVPSPSFATISNDVMALSVGDHGRLGWADVQRGLGNGITYKASCGLLYEGGIIVSAGGKVVDNIRAGRSINDHFRPIKRFRDPDPSVGIIEDAKAPDSMRLGVRIEQRVRMAAADSGLFINDVSIRNISDSTLHDVAIGWFFDWDLGGVPGENRVRDVYRGGQDAMATAVAQRGDAPIVTCAVTTPYAQARPFMIGIDNTITYSAMPPRMKDSLMRMAPSYADVNDVSMMGGVVFDGALRPGEQRLLRLVIAVDDSVARSQQLAVTGIVQRDARVPQQVTVFPQPATDRCVVSVDVRGPEIATATMRIRDAVGRLIATSAFVDIGPGGLLLPVDVSRLASGRYAIELVVSTGGAMEAQRTVVPLVVVR